MKEALCSRGKREKIRNRNSRWNRKRDMMDVLYDIQQIMKLWDTLNMDAFTQLIWFALDQLPVAEGSVSNGDVTDEYVKFIEEIPKITLEELYEKAMKPVRKKK